MTKDKTTRKITPIPEFALQHIGLAFGLVGELQRQLYAEAITPLGISEQQLYILMALTNLGPQVQAHLSVPLKIDKATMVGLINDLEQKGLVERKPHPSDRRAVLVHLTEAGQTRLGRGLELSDQFVQRAFKGVSVEEQQLLQKVLVKLAANAQEISASYEETAEK